MSKFVDDFESRIEEVISRDGLLNALGKDVAFVAAHHDDIEINAGGLLHLMLSCGHNVKVITLTNSACGGDPELRKQEFANSMYTLSQGTPGTLEIVNLDFPDTHLHEHLKDAISKLEPHLKGVKTVITHHPEESHQDHSTTNKVVLTAGRHCNNLFYFQPSWPSGRLTVAFNTDLIIRFGQAVMTRKWDSLNCHKSQITKYGSEEYLDSVKAVNKANSLLNTGDIKAYAEVFEIQRIIL